MSRRNFVQTVALAGAGAHLFLRSTSMAADPLNLPIGLQLYTVGTEFDSDPHGTLDKVATIGYRQVELSPLSKAPTGDIKKALAGSGLKNPSGHYLVPDLLTHLEEKIDTAGEFGQKYMIVTTPWVADISRFQSKAANPMEMFKAMLNGLTLDDWKWNAEQFNKIGEQTKKAGLQLGYHNHNFEFRKFGDTTGYDEFLRLTDPELVALELDCGWMTVAGLDPVTYLTKFPNRYRLLHIKDFKKGFTPTITLLSDAPGTPVPTELGRGAIDYTPILAAARNGIRGIFVEQEPPFKEMPALEAIKVDFAYLNTLKVG
ncbi:MAG TPA: sugar phosphate isomerase/epimerase [Terracidiphilus sp.]|jgi:sugar phosphate isomerase/epimerase|nr:sugar phosphate isomerase/epimerase [Terracidiphilus sp.]